MDKPFFPDTNDLFERKAQARQERARMPLRAKIVILESMRRELLPFREATHQARRRAEQIAPENQPVP